MPINILFSPLKFPYSELRSERWAWMSKTFFMSFFTPIFFLVYPALKVMLLSHFGHFFQLFWFWFTVFFFLSSFEKTCTKIYWTESATAVDKSVYNMFTVSLCDIKLFRGRLIPVWRDWLLSHQTFFISCI